jgi:hypothetical protein
MFVPAKLLCDWSQQWPRNKDDTESDVSGKVGRVYIIEDGPASDFIFVP